MCNIRLSSYGYVCNGHICTGYGQLVAHAARAALGKAPLSSSLPHISCNTYRNVVSWQTYGKHDTTLLVAGVLILSEFTGASQSLGAGAILVNPWNITDLSAAIGDALTMTDAERRERHRQNYMHISIHTSQTWADTFISELNDTHVEAELRTKHIPPQVGTVLFLCRCAVLCCAVLCCAVLCGCVNDTGCTAGLFTAGPCCAVLQ